MRKFILTILFSLMMIPALSYAGIYFITEQGERSDVYTGKAKEKPCVVKGYKLTSCSGNKSPFNLCSSDKSYFKECKCDTNVYKYDSNNCTGGKALSGTTCDGKYSSCGCDLTRYKYSSSNCKAPKELSGGSCDSLYEGCSCPSTYSKRCDAPMTPNSEACDRKYSSCKCTSNFYNCTNGPSNGAASCVEESGTTKYSACRSLTCEDIGMEKRVPINQTCTEIKMDKLVCYTDCRPRDQ